jgi:hypothetical protein
MVATCNDTGCALDKCMDGGLMSPGACVVGRCNAGFDCDSSHVACLTPTPQCPPGEVPSVKGACWGTCVSAAECAYVDACAACGPSQACVHYGGGVMKTYCVEIAPECGGKASCACMGQSLCNTVPCGEQNGELTCQAP